MRFEIVLEYETEGEARNVFDEIRKAYESGKINVYI